MLFAHPKFGVMEKIVNLDVSATCNVYLGLMFSNNLLVIQIHFYVFRYRDMNIFMGIAVKGCGTTKQAHHVQRQGMRIRNASIVRIK